MFKRKKDKIIISILCSLIVTGLSVIAIHYSKEIKVKTLSDLDIPIVQAMPSANQEKLIELEEILSAEPEDEKFPCAMMTFTQEEAQLLLDRFEQERIEEQRRIEEEKRKKEEAERKAKARTYGASTYSANVGPSNYGDNELFMLAVIIGQETGGINEEIMMAVGNVVMNRIADPRFPNTMYGVLTGQNQYGRESGNFYFNSYVTSSAQERCYAVARRLLNGERVLPANVVWQAGFPQGNGTYAYYDTYPYGTYLCY